MLCETKLNLRITQGYGMTELTCTGISFAEGLEGDSGGSVGRLLPNCECKLLDDDGKEVGAGTPGELFIRGPNVCLGYWRNEAATRESLDKDGWFRTGDIAVCDSKGMFAIVDRKKVSCAISKTYIVANGVDVQELIKVNGLQVAPAELEAVLLENEHVADAAVVEIKLYVTLPKRKTMKKPPSLVSNMLTNKTSQRRRGMATRIRRHPANLKGQSHAQGHPGLDRHARRQAQAAGRRRHLHRRGAQAGQRQDHPQADEAVVQEGCRGDAEEWDATCEVEAVDSPFWIIALHVFPWILDI